MSTLLASGKKKRGPDQGSSRQAKKPPAFARWKGELALVLYRRGRKGGGGGEGLPPQLRRRAENRERKSSLSKQEKKERVPREAGGRDALCVRGREIWKKVSAASRRALASGKTGERDAGREGQVCKEEKKLNEPLLAVGSRSYL